MTFYEAAVEVLRRSGRPLHYKKITEIAVREDLLSHVGKTPQVTMNDRLEKEIQKDEVSAIIQERPGVFKLDDENAEEITERIKKKRKRELESKRKREQQSRDDSDSGDGSSHKRRRSRGSRKEDEPKTRKKEESDEDRSRGGDRDGQNKRKRSRDESNDDDQRRSRAGTGSPRGGGDVEIEISEQSHLEEGPVRLEGIPKAAYRVLSESDRGSLPIDELADRIFDQKLVKFHTHEPVATVQSALANDNQIRQEYGHRPLFAHAANQWRLTEWDLEADVLEREQAALSLTEEIRQATTEQLAQALREVQSEALEHVALTLLERLGYRNIKVSKRSSEGDVFFTADWRQGLADVRVCVRVVTDHDRELKGSAVQDLRETLDHYSASEGLIIHLGEVADDAVQKARVDGEAPITVFDETTFVELLMKHGIGVQTYRAPIVTIDSDFIDALAD